MCPNPILCRLRSNDALCVVLWRHLSTPVGDSNPGLGAAPCDLDCDRGLTHRGSTAQQDHVTGEGIAHLLGQLGDAQIYARQFLAVIGRLLNDRAKRAITRADVVLYLLDATTEISQVDEQLGKLIVDSHKPVVIVLNKWDIAKDGSDQSGRKVTPKRYEDYIRKELKGLSFAPIAIISAKEGLNVTETLEIAMEMFEQASHRVGTGQLNRTISSIIEARGPSNKLGAEARVYFASQVKTNPPTLVLVVNDPDRFTLNYERYLMNRIRELLPFGEVPIKLILRARSRVEKRAKSTSGKQLHMPDQSTGRFDEDMAIETIDRDAFLADLPDDASAYFDD